MYNLNQTIPWIESPFFLAELATSDLSEDNKIFVKNYAEEGYAIIDPEINEEIIDNVIRTLSSKFEKNGTGERIINAWKFNEFVRQVAISDAVFKKLRLLYQREPIPFQTLNFSVGTEQKTHSDMIHFNSIPQRFMCGVWVALEDITNDNGPLHYYPKSHKLPFYDMLDVGIKASENIEEKKAMMAYIENYEIFVEEMAKTLSLPKKLLNIKKGQAMIWAANLLHGGEMINNTNSSRHSQVTHYYFDDCLYYVPRLSDIAINKTYLSDLINIKTGKKVINTYFGEEVKPYDKLHLQQGVVSILSKVSHLFPKPLVKTMKSIIVR